MIERKEKEKKTEEVCLTEKGKREKERKHAFTKEKGGREKRNTPNSEEKEKKTVTEKGK